MLKKESNRRYHAANREKVKEYHRKWYAANREQHNEQTRKWKAAHPERIKYLARRWSAANSQRVSKLNRLYLLNSYGLTTQSYDAMLATQGGGCAICRRKPEKSSLAIDHCHATGVVRGLLCHQCNTTIGKHFDSPEKLRAILRYVEKHSQLGLGKRQTGKRRLT